MKLAYKDEQDMVDLASGIDDGDICFYPAESAVAHRFLKSLRSGGLSQRERPDFEEPAASLLLEVMVVDDHPRPGKKDKTRARQAAVLRELKEAGLDVHPDVRVLASVNSGLPTDLDHSYTAYVDQFKRTVKSRKQSGDVQGRTAGVRPRVPRLRRVHGLLRNLGRIRSARHGPASLLVRRFGLRRCNGELQRGLHRLADTIQDHAYGRQSRVPAPDDDHYRRRPPAEPGRAPRLRRASHGLLRRLIPTLRTGNRPRGSSAFDLSM